ncbi:hypothetical protein [Alkalibacillus silvisoli]|uniref:Uncharacterized protein n=1 Tax=Alkalibacillus silvisoli TaxID=392823 RepID=A0ABN0ZL86_9BACI
MAKKGKKNKGESKYWIADMLSFLIEILIYFPRLIVSFIRSIF